MSREVERNTQRLACTLYIRLVDLFVDALDRVVRVRLLAGCKPALKIQRGDTATLRLELQNCDLLAACRSRRRTGWEARAGSGRNSGLREPVVDTVLCSERRARGGTAK